MDVNTRISLTEFQQMVKNPQYTPQKPAVSMTSGKDTCSFSRDIVTVVVKPENEYDTGVLITKVNNKDGHLKFSEPKPSEAWVEGDIEGKKFLIHKEGNVYKGNYDNKDFELCVEAGEQATSRLKRLFNSSEKMCKDYFNVSGNLGDSVISLKMPNAKIPDNEDFKDLLSILLWTKHQKATTIGNEIKSIEYSNDGYDHKTRVDKAHEKSQQKFWQNPVVQTGMTVLTTLGISWLTKKLL